MTVILLMLQTETDTACVLLNERVAKEISATTDGISGKTNYNTDMKIHYSNDGPNNTSQGTDSKLNSR
jgi:hypothetical protein